MNSWETEKIEGAIKDIRKSIEVTRNEMEYIHERMGALENKLNFWLKELIDKVSEMERGGRHVP